jgi:putative ABC transport system substrate-binding protein
LLKEIAPSVKHVGIILNPESSPFAVPIANATVAAAPKFELKAESIPLRGADQVEAAFARVATEAGGGLMFLPDPYTANLVKLIVGLCEQHKLPAVYGLKLMVAEGGLLSYGIDLVGIFRDAAGYVDRILKGEKPADLPVQQPTKYELVINLRAARAIGLAVPPTLLVRADSVIE